jgi:hypothetical protein
MTIYLIITTSIYSDTVLNQDMMNTRIKNILQNVAFTLALVQPFHIRPIIVEGNGLRSTPLDIFKCDIVYTNNNFQKFHNYGVNELMDIVEVCKRYDIDDDDMVLKISGRYELTRPDVFRLIVEYERIVDAFIRFGNVCDTTTYTEDDCILGFIGMKCKFWRAFKYTSGSCEREIVQYIKKLDYCKLNHINLNYLDKNGHFYCQV